jgi:hypothetical protein
LGASEFRLNTAVAFMIFNRPDATAYVFSEIAKAKPPKLLVVADGPRLDQPGEAERCARARALIERVDWPCEVIRNYAETNLGCRRRVSSGLDWVFQMVEEAIILEDDCLPHPTFVRFCEELLERYRDDERVMHISGTNFQFGRRRGRASYYFSLYAHIWGWASWRRAWRHYDAEMKDWASGNSREMLLATFPKRMERRFWEWAWDGASSGRIDTWDFQWGYSCLAQSGLAITPNVNLVSNIGFGQNSTHTNSKDRLAELPVSPIELPLVHPKVFLPDSEADEVTGRLFFRYPTLARRVSDRGRRVLLGSLSRS